LDSWTFGHFGTLDASACDMSDLSRHLKERTMSFAVSILRLVGQFPVTTGAQVVGRQLAKSATSVGANYCAVCSARSDAEFLSKLCIVNEEADEVVYWLELASRSQFLCPEDFVQLKNEAIQLRAIFGSSLRTVRQRVKRNTGE
jgi:four helix bundle protein